MAELLFVPKVEIKDFNVLIDGKNFFDTHILTKKKQMNKLLK